MLKRNQVLLNDWLVDLLKAISEKYDLSFSEIIRLLLSMEIIDLITAAYPDYKNKAIKREVLGLIELRNKGQTISMEDSHRIISKVYFEGRKAAEHWNKHQKSKKTKKK